jgi:hypothetical protein
MPTAAVISARRIGSAHFFFCSSAPKDKIEAAMIATPWGLKLW